MHYSWPEFHGAITHFPVAMIIAAFMFEAGALLFKKPEWRVVSFWCLVVGVVGAVPALVSGWTTGSATYASSPNPPSVFTSHRLAAFVTSGIALLLLVWRIATKDKMSGAVLMAALTVLLLATVGVSYTGYLGGDMAIGSGGGTESPTSTPVASATPAPNTGGAPATAPTVQPADLTLIAQGQAVYASQPCANCHTMDGKGGRGGPNLSHEGADQPDIAWQVKHLSNPQSVTPDSSMPAYKSLGDAKLKQLAAFLVSKK